jgi:hypothetical protein
MELDFCQVTNQPTEHSFHIHIGGKYIAMGVLTSPPILKQPSKQVIRYKISTKLPQDNRH